MVAVPAFSSAGLNYVGHFAAWAGEHGSLLSSVMTGRPQLLSSGRFSVETHLGKAILLLEEFERVARR